MVMGEESPIVSCQSVDLQSIQVPRRNWTRLLALATIVVSATAQSIEQAERSFDSGNYTEAARLFDKAYKETKNCQALFGLGLSEYRLKHVDPALIALQSSVQCDPNLVVAYLALGEAYSERANDQGALSAFLHVLKLEPRNAAGLHGAALIYLRGKVPQKAIEALETLIQVEPNDAQAHVDLGAEYLATGNQEGAEGQFEAALRLKPGDKAALLGLGNSYLRKGDDQQAVATLEKVIKLAPGAAEPRFLIGCAYNRLSRFPDAVTELQNALRLGEEDAQIYYHLARAYGGLGDAASRSRALAKFSELTKKSKQDTEDQRTSLKLVESAKGMVETGNLKGAADSLEAARELRPSDDTILFRLASVSYDLNRYDAARSYVEEAISLVPSDWLYHYLLGMIEVQSSRWSHAKAALQVALQLNASAAEIHNALGQVAAGQGDLQGAKSSFQHAIDLDPSNQEYRVNLKSVSR
jgi:tetratricopeptide (TPR) repeat protein